jgi:hypothetical protein
MNIPGGSKQLWIYELDQCGDPGWLVLYAKSTGVTGLVVKAWDGATYLPQCEQVIELAHACGLMVTAWGYNYGTNIPGEVAAMEQAVSSGKADALILDVEVEFDNAGGQALAEALITALKASKISYAGWGFTSFGLPSYHPQFPFEIFAKSSWGAFPQVYFGDFGLTPETALTRSVTQYTEYGVPIIPIGQAYSNPVVNYVANAADIQAFGAAAAGAKLQAIGIYSAQNMTLALFAAVKTINL